MTRAIAPAAPPAAQGAPGAAEPAAGGAMLRAHIPLLVLLTLTHMVVDAYASTVPALLPFWQTRFGLSYGLAGLITAISNVTSSVAQPIVGLVTDRGRDPRWVALSCLVAAAGIGATGLVPSYALFLALVVIGGLGVSGFHPQGYKLTGLFAGKNQAAATSWFLVGGNVGIALGPLAGTALAVRFGPEGTGFMFLPGLAFAAALWWLVPQWTRAGGAAHGFVRPYRAGGEQQPGQPGVELRGPETAPIPEGMVGLGTGRRATAIAVLVALVALRSTVSSSLISFVPLYYVRVAGAGEAEASRMLAGMLLAGAVATLGGGYLADRLGRVRVLAGTLAAAPPLLLLFVAAEPGSIAAAASLWAAGALVTASFSITLVLAQDLWYERRALASGVIVGFAFGVGGLLVPVVGTIADGWGLATALRLLAAIPLATLALVAILAALLRPKR